MHFTRHPHGIKTREALFNVFKTETTCGFAPNDRDVVIQLAEPVQQLACHELPM